VAKNFLHTNYNRKGEKIMILYTTPTCPKCKVIKMKLEKAGINYTVNENIEDMERIGIRSVPVLQKDGQLLDFNAIVQFLREEEAKQ
jgi:glutaredoxin